MSKVPVSAAYVVPTSVLDQLTDVQVVALTIWAEARSQPLTGMFAVALVIRNRLRRHLPKRWGTTYRAICLKPEQFSCWNDPGKNGKRLAAKIHEVLSPTTHSDPVFSCCLSVATEVMENVIPDFTGGADHYLTLELYGSDRCPSWAKKMTAVLSVADHLFLKE